MKLLLMVLILVAACALAFYLMTRLSDAQQKLAALHDDLRHNDLKLQNEMEKLDALKSDDDASTHEEKIIEQHEQ